MMQTQGQSSHFEDRKTAETLLGQAHLCEQIASACTDEAAADKFKKMARDCRQAAEDCVVRN
jgi:hypothetical protein